MKIYTLIKLIKEIPVFIFLKKQSRNRYWLIRHNIDDYDIIEDWEAGFLLKTRRAKSTQVL